MPGFFDETCEHLRLKLPLDVQDACRFLEACGLVFAVDFGYQNAHERAGELIVYGGANIPRAYRTGEDLP